MKRSKSYRSAAEKIDADKAYSPLEAVRLAKSTASAKYDETVEIAFRLGVDPRKADQMVRGTVNLPHGTGKTARVIVFAVGEKAEAALAAGADEVGSDEADQRLEVGGADFLAAMLLPAEFITNYTLLGIKQRFTDDEVGLLHVVYRRVKQATRRPLARRKSEARKLRNPGCPAGRRPGPGPPPLRSCLPG